MGRGEKIFNTFFVLIAGIIVMGMAFTERAVAEGATGFLIGTSIFAFVVGSDMLKEI